MSFWDELKELLYKPVKQDSRNLEKLGQAWNIPWLENEANRNVDNPGRAVGKAAGAAATWYLGGLLGGAGGAANAGSGVGAGAGALSNTAINMGTGAATTQAQLMKTIAQNPSMFSGLLSIGANMNDPKSMQMAKMGMGLLDGGQQPQPMMAPPPRQQASPEPLPAPYGGNALEGPPPGMTWEEWMRRKQMMMGRM